MAWRIAKSVVRGEIDNRTPGCVTGRIWLWGREAPIELDLHGNCHRDLAGRRTTFDNPSAAEGDNTGLQTVQQGVVGDMTASRKTRTSDAPVEDAERPALILEWFSDVNGRVVVESTGFTLHASPPAWIMSAEQEREQIAANQRAIRDWLDRLSGSYEDEEADDSLDAPMDEFEWEKFMKESDAMTEKYGQLLEKYRDDPDCDRIVAREMGWTWLEDALDAEERGALSDQAEEQSEEVGSEEEEYEPLEPDPLTEGINWVREDNGHVHHPLTARASRVSMAIWHHCGELGLLGENGDPDVQEMVFQSHTLSAKLAGALDHLAYESEREPGFVVACLKRALTYLHASIAASEKVANKKILDPTRFESFRRSIFEIREQILVLMESYRRKLW